MKTARFADVVAAAGPPRVHSLWVAPARDADLKRAVRDCRVMTLHQRLRGTKKDYGTIGLQADQSSQVLVFPKSLRRFGAARIVGIDYRLIVQPEANDPAPALPKQTQTVGSPLAATSRVRSAQAPTLHSAKQRTRPGPGTTAKPTAHTRAELLDEIRRAVRELQAGKVVAAQERLRKLS